MALYYRAAALFRQGQLEQSVVALERFLEMEPANSLHDDALLYLGQALEATGRLPHAKAVYLRLLTDHPNLQGRGPIIQHIRQQPETDD